uniref:Uncharacterized protein n=1 Tax=Anguilla anguilla TaxID=7936 RepID=A0A0E9PDG0_ANGAN
MGRFTSLFEFLSGLVLRDNKEMKLQMEKRQWIFIYVSLVL